MSNSIRKTKNTLMEIISNSTRQHRELSIIFNIFELMIRVVSKSIRTNKKLLNGDLFLIQLDNTTNCYQLNWISLLNYCCC